MSDDFVKPKHSPPKGWSPWEKCSDMAWESRDETNPRISAPRVTYSEIDGRCMIRARNGGTEITAFGKHPEDLAQVCCSVGLVEWSPKVPEKDGWWWVRVDGYRMLIVEVFVDADGSMFLDGNHYGILPCDDDGVEFICEAFPPVTE